MPDRPGFDPLTALAVLERNRVAFVTVGGLGRILHGADEVADTLEIVPSLRADNLKRLDAALTELGVGGTGLPLTLADSGEPVAVETNAGPLTITPVPPGTRGYDDLRRAATREPLGGGVRAPVAALGDLIRMLAAGDRAEEDARLRSLRRLVELDRSPDRGVSR